MRIDYVMKTGTIEYQPFEVTVPDLSGANVKRIITIQVPVEWDDESKEWLMTEEGSLLVAETKARAMGRRLNACVEALESIPVEPSSVYWNYRKKAIANARKPLP